MPGQIEQKANEENAKKIFNNLRTLQGNESPIQFKQFIKQLINFSKSLSSSSTNFSAQDWANHIEGIMKDADVTQNDVQKL
ncbi:MAG: hypothetical protein WBE18_02730 [Gammaproteobacteria bacterium]